MINDGRRLDSQHPSEIIRLKVSAPRLILSAVHAHSKLQVTRQRANGCAETYIILLYASL